MPHHDRILDHINTRKIIDGVYGHQYLARRNVAAALATKVDDGSIDLDRALEIATWLFVDNPRRLFGLAAKSPTAKSRVSGNTRKHR